MEGIWYAHFRSGPLKAMGWPFWATGLFRAAIPNTFIKALFGRMARPFTRMYAWLPARWRGTFPISTIRFQFSAGVDCRRSRDDVWPSRQPSRGEDGCGAVQGSLKSQCSVSAGTSQLGILTQCSLGGLELRHCGWSVRRDQFAEEGSCRVLCRFWARRKSWQLKTQ